jgi:hypothetical protein
MSRQCAYLRWLLRGWLRLGLRLLLWRGRGRRRWWDGDCWTAGRCLHHLRRSGRVLPSCDRDTAGDNGSRRDAETSSGDEVAPRYDRPHLLVS